MYQSTRQNIRLFRLLAFLVLLAAIFLVVGSVGAASIVSRPDALFDGGGFPTPTPTATLIPTLAPTQPIIEAPTSPPVDALIPTATSIPYPFPTFDSNLVGGGESQAQPDNGSSSPSLVTLALPFLCALSLLVGVVVYWVRNARTSTQ